jgi:hypothetical protein
LGSTFCPADWFCWAVLERIAGVTQTTSPGPASRQTNP